MNIEAFKIIRHISWFYLVVSFRPSKQWPKKTGVLDV